MENFFIASQPRVLSILRIVTAFMFMQHGGQKLFGYPAPQRAGTCRWFFNPYRFVDQTGSLYFVRPDGSRLLYRSCPAGILAFIK